MASIRIENLTQDYGAVRALDGVNLEIREGEFFSLLGPSGSGKTTLLRLIAGFELPTEGAIAIDEEVVTHLPPERRRVGMVFQNYALFPHLNVFDNVAYGLRAAKKRLPEIRPRVEEMLNLVELGEYGDRDVHSLSGGQQQRVALARAIAPHPRVLLMDEPLSNLDARLRLQTRRQLLDLQRRLGMTTVYVTHDQSEALSLSDRLAVMLEGRVIQVGTPKEAYNHPSSVAVAEFLGEMNWLPCKCVQPQRPGVIQVFGHDVSLETSRMAESMEISKEQTLLVGIRPEGFAPAGILPDGFEATVKTVQYEGAAWRLEMEWEGPGFTATFPASWLPDEAEPGRRINLSFDRASVCLFPGENGQ